MVLQWNEIPAGALMASGEDWVYLIAWDNRQVTLTRWEPRPGQTSGEVAAQAAMYAIQVGGVYEAIPESADVMAVPEAAAVMIEHLKRSAQAYESGLDVTGQPRWRHGYQPGQRAIRRDGVRVPALDTCTDCGAPQLGPPAGDCAHPFHQESTP